MLNDFGADLEQTDFRALFDAAPELYLILRPDDPVFTILFANRAYANATMPDQAATIAGAGLFEVFPDNSGGLLASLHQVLTTKAPHKMAARKYDILRLKEQGAFVEERYWSAVNTPVMDGADVRFIIHRMEDVTEFVRLKSMERQEVEAKLAESQARYTLVFAQAPIGMVLLTPAGALVEVNQAFVDMLGYSRNELLLQDSSRITHPEDVALTKSFFASLRKGTHRTQSLEKRYIRSDGDILWARTWVTMRRDERGDPVEVIAIVEDITAGKRADVRYQFLAESIPEMVWTATPAGMIDYVNGQGTSYFGVPQATLLGAAWFEWIHWEEKDAAIELWKQSLITGKPYEKTVRLRRGGDCNWRWHLVRARPFTGEKGAVAQWLGTCTDIEDQKQADAKLHQQWRTFDTALSNTPDFTYTFDLAGRFTYVNRALLALWQKSLDEAIGKNFQELDYPPDLAARLQEQIRQVIDTRRPVRDQTPYTGAAGECRYYEYILVPVIDADGRVKAVAGSTRDTTERNIAALQIEEDRRRWRELLIQTPAGIAVLRGTDHRFEWVNPDYARLVARPPEALIGKTVLEAFPEVEGQIYMHLLKGVYETGTAFTGHESLIRLDRGGSGLQDLYINFAYLATRDVAGAIDGIFVYVTEVTDLVIARKRVEASEERFRLAFQAVEGIVYDWNPQTGSVERSGNLERLIGVSTAEAEPTAAWWQERVHPADRAAASLNQLPLLNPATNQFETEFRVRHADGHWVYLCDRGYVVRDEDGTALRVVGSTHDVTKERTLLDALRQSEARFRQAIDSMPQLVWSTLADGEPDLFNKQWLEYTGLSAGGAPGDEWLGVHPDDRPLVSERWRQSLDDGAPFEVEFRFRRFDAQYRWFLGRATAIRDDGRIVRWFVTSTDIEDRKRAELAVLTKQKLESLGLLAGGIAHDFNNLLVGVLGGASFAAEDLPSNHHLQPILEGITTSAERAAHLTRQMLAYAGKGRFLVERIDLGELARSTCTLIKASIPKHVRLTLDIARDLPAIEADSGQMQQIMMNLILNAAEAIDLERMGRVTVRTYLAILDLDTIGRTAIVAGSLVPGSYVVFEVQDNGSGMDHETQTKIFDPFFTTKFMGRGLGLSAVQGILRTQNGALELNSQLGEGSRFRVFLPITSGATVCEPLPRDRTSNETGTLLVVDDEEIVLKTSKASLERDGFYVLLADSGERAMRILLDHQTPPIDLIILDMSMPTHSGKDVMEQIRVAGIDVPVLICSGYGEAEVYREFSGLDIAGFIQKPFTARQLAERIREALPKKARVPAPL